MEDEPFDLEGYKAWVLQKMRDFLYSAPSGEWKIGFRALLAEVEGSTQARPTPAP